MILNTIKSILFSLGCFLLFADMTFAQTVEWARVFSSAKNENVRRLATDDKGNAYIGVTTDNPLKVGNDTYPLLGGVDIFIMQVNSVGNIQWIKQLGSTNDDDLASVEYVNGEVVVGALISGLGSVDNVTILGITVAKLNPTDGRVKSAATFGSSIMLSGGSGFFTATRTLPDGSSYMVGDFKGTIDEQGIKLTSSGVLWDGFIAKTKANGQLEWVRRADLVSNQHSWNQIYPTADGYVACGYFSDTIQFGTVTLKGKGGIDGLCVWFKADGSYVQHLHIDTTAADSVYGIVPSSDGNWWIWGIAGDTPSGFPTFPASSGFIAKIRNDAAVQTSIGFGLPIYDVQEVNKQVFAVGQFSGSTLNGKNTLNANGPTDGFLARFNLNLSNVWTQGLGGTGYDRVSRLAIDTQGNVYLGMISWSSSISLAGNTYANPDATTDNDARTAEGILVKLKGAALVANETDVTLPKDFTLSQNYPNPFNPKTNITFSLPKSSAVTLKVYNSLGEEMATLMQNTLPAGEHHVSFDAQNLPSGLYLYRLQMGDAIITKQMTVIK